MGVVRTDSLEGRPVALLAVSTTVTLKVPFPTLASASGVVVTRELPVFQGPPKVVPGQVNGWAGAGPEGTATATTTSTMTEAAPTRRPRTSWIGHAVDQSDEQPHGCDEQHQFEEEFLRHDPAERRHNRGQGRVDEVPPSRVEGWVPRSERCVGRVRVGVVADQNRNALDQPEGAHDQGDAGQPSAVHLETPQEEWRPGE